MRAVDSVEAQRPNRNGPQRKRMRWHYDYLKKLM
jgi:Uri superfamily endonuclease